MNNLFMDGYPLPKPLTAEETDKLFKEARSGSEEARELLIVHNMRLVMYEVAKFQDFDRLNDELASVGNIGLIKAVDTFNIEKGYNFQLTLQGVLIMKYLCF